MNLRKLYSTLKAAGIDLDAIDRNGYPLLCELLEELYESSGVEYDTEISFELDADQVPLLVEEIITAVGLTQLRRMELDKCQYRLHETEKRYNNAMAKVEYLEKIMMKSRTKRGE